jgi:dipeptidyl aminopeptidase/acylaminoacyl peptidase
MLPWLPAAMVFAEALQAAAAPDLSASAVAQPSPPVAMSSAVPAGAVELTADLLSANAAKAKPPRLPTTAFSAQPLLDDPLLSPDGTHFVARFNGTGKTNLAIFDITGQQKPLGINFEANTDLIRYFWAGNRWVLFTYGITVPMFDGDAYATRMTAIDVTTGDQHSIKVGDGLTGDDVLWIDPTGQTLLLAYQSSVYEEPTVYSVDIATSKATRVVAPYRNIWDWYADAAGVVRWGYGWPDEHHWQMVYRKDAADPFLIVAKGTDKDDDAENMAEDKAFSLAVGSDEGYAYARDQSTGLTAIYHYNFATHTRGDLVFEAQGSDIDVAALTDDGKDMFSAIFTDSRDRVKWWDLEMKSFQESLDKAVNATIGDREAWVVSRNRDHSIMLVDVMGSNDPGHYYVYQQATGKMSLLSVRNAELSPDNLATSHYVHYAARDGAQIPAYLTLPLGRAAKGLPLIILPHGGPFGIRDHGDFDSDVQFFANRGYVVLQPEYRGSGSYGKGFDDEGSGQWGRAMQDDLDDGMDWLVKQGIVDPKRVCMVGGSYGGYAALWAATRNPERYRCAVSLAGVSDLGQQLKYQLNSFGDRQAREKWRQKVQGAATFDLKSVSPINNIDRLKVPVMLVHGDKDQTVPQKQSKRYADALKTAGKTYEYYSLPGEGHGLSTVANAQLWYDKLDAFLAKYNPAESSGS